MLVLCPSCETEYEIPSLQRPRKLRCARCASEWRVVPEGEPAPATVGVPVLEIPGFEMPGLDSAEPDGPILEPDLATGAQPESGTAVPGALSAEQPLSPSATPWNAAGRVRLGRDVLVIGLLWLLSVALVIAGLWALWHWRVPISHRWPPSLRLYRLLPNGVPVPHVGHRRLAA